MVNKRVFFVCLSVLLIFLLVIPHEDVLVCPQRYIGIFERIKSEYGALKIKSSPPGAGTFITKWGGIGTSDGEFNEPRKIDVDSSGYVYVADYSNNRIQKFGPNNQVTSSSLRKK